MNKAELTGRLTREPDVRYGGQDNATAIVRFTLAVGDRGKETDFVSIKAIGKLGEWVQKYLHKGSKVELVGKIKTGSYDKDGSKLYYTEVLAQELNFGESKAEAAAHVGSAGSNDFMNIPGDELPFN